MRAKKCFVLFLIVSTIVYLDAKKLSKSRTSGRRSGQKTNPQPVPTSQSAHKPTLFGWQEKPAQRSQATGSRQSKPSSQQHSYPSSQTGLSGKPAKQPTQDNVQRSHSSPQNAGANQQSGNHQSNVNQQNHAYPASNGMSGQPNAGASYPNQQGGLSGNTAKQPPSYQESMQKSNSHPQNNAQPNHGYPASHGLSGSSGGGYPSHQGAPPPYSGGQYPNGAHGSSNYGNNYRAPPPAYPGNYGPSHGGYGGHNPGYNPGYGSQMPGYFGGYGNNNGRGFGGMSRGSALTGVGIAGAGVGTLLTGLALWNLARSTGNRHHTVIYDNRGQPVAVAPGDNATTVDPILGDLVNCSLTISNKNATEVLAIPCSIATSFSPEADVKDSTSGDSDKDATVCTVTVVNKASREFMTTIPCSILLNSAAENNVTEPPEIVNGTMNNITGSDIRNDTINNPSQGVLEIPSALSLDINNNNTTKNCTVLEPGTTRDPLNPCFALTYDVSVQPLPSDDVVNSTTSPIIN